MAKGNLILGTSSGKVGDLVTYRKHGAQITRVYNGNPANPRTDKQMIKRVQWASITPVYAQNKTILDQTFSRVPRGSSAQRQFYRFNYDKVLLSPKATNEAYKASHFVPFGKFIVSYGSLPFFPPSLLTLSNVYDRDHCSACTITLNKDRYIHILNELSPSKLPISLSLGEVWQHYFKGTNYEGQRLGIITNRLGYTYPNPNVTSQYDYVSTGFSYYELHPHFLNDQPINFIYETGEWHIEGNRGWVGTIDDDTFSLYLQSQFTLEVKIVDNLGGIAFFAVDPITKNTSTSHIEITPFDNDFNSWIADHATPEYIQMCIDTYKGEPTPPTILINE